MRSLKPGNRGERSFAKNAIRKSRVKSLPVQRLLDQTVFLANAMGTGCGRWLNARCLLSDRLVYQTLQHAAQQVVRLRICRAAEKH